ncbi:MAG TPA: hypothetical protein VL025_12565, partial [Thermoanaerobaculia bacterium]|nr:hypothetical protein [Thermoanaerobaculia bacterium]
AALQFFIELVAPLVAIGKPLEQQLQMTFAMMALSQTTLLLGAAAYAGFLKHRSRASLSGCVVGGAAVGLLANSASQVAKSVLLGLAVVVVLDGAFRAALLMFLPVTCLLAGLGGLIIGEVGGGLVGLVPLRRWARNSASATLLLTPHDSSGKVEP